MTLQATATRSSEVLNILHQSPLDALPLQESEPTSAAEEATRWMPSRYNIQATTPDRQLLLWNTLTGSICRFSAEQRPTIRELLKRDGIEGPADELIGYLRKRGFLVEADRDEYETFQLAFGRQHYASHVFNLTLLSSEDCNFRCSYCYEEFAHGTMLPWVRTAIKSLVEKNLERTRILHVSWFGGEPLYGFKAIEELAPFIQERAEENEVRYWSHMSTNGYLLRPEIAEKLLDWGVRSYQITIDGPPEDHNRSRPTRDGGGTFETIFQNLKEMKAFPHEFEVNIRVNFDKANYPRIDSLLDDIATEFRDDGRYNVRFRPVGRWGGRNDGNLDVFLANEADQAMFALEEKAIEMGLRSCDSLEFSNHFGSEACYAGRPYHYIIGATGKIMKCTVALDLDPVNVVGQLTPDGDLDLDWGKFAAWTKPSFHASEKCKKCPVLPQCQRLSCPKKQIYSGSPPCISLRENAKRALLTMAKVRESRGKYVEVTH